MKHKVIYLLTMAMVAGVSLKAQLNVGSTAPADASAILQATSTTKGFLPPVMTTSQINAIVLPANGLTVYNSTLSQLQVNVGTTFVPSWSVVAGGGNVYWSQQGNTGTVPGTNYIGTTDNAGLGLRTNGVERVRIDSATGNVGIGTSTPFAPLQLANTLANRKIVLWDGGTNASNDSMFFGFGINGSTLRYQVPTGSQHSFYMNKTLIANLTPGNSTFYASSATANSSISLGRLGYEAGINVAGFNNNFAIGTVPGDLILRVDTGSLYVETFSAKPLMFNTSNSERMRITSTGLVGINNPAPIATLDIAGNMRLASAASGTTTDSILTINSSTGIINKRTLTNVNSNIYNSDGTVTANRTMQLNGNTLTLNGNPGGWEGTGLNVLSGNINNGSFIGFGRTTSDGFVGIMSGGNNLAFANSVPGDMFILANQKLMMGTNSSAAVVLETSAAERMRITPAGNVGINITNPSQTLQANGVIKAGLDNNGSILLNPGTGSQAGYLRFYKGDGVSTPGFIGYDNTDLYYRAENGAQHRFSGANVIVENNVGIGTSSPGEKLEVDGNIRLGGDPVTATMGYGNYIEFDGNGVNTDPLGMARFNVSGDQTELRMVLGDNPNSSSSSVADRFVLGTINTGVVGSIASTSFSPVFFIYSNGQTGIGGVSPNASYMLDVNGNIHTNASVIAGGTTLTSDRRLKKNIISLHSALANVMKLAPVSYEKKSSINSTDYSFKEMGFVAQDLQKIFPQLVHEGTDADKTLSVDYNSLIPVLTKAIQEQQAQNDTQVALNKRQQAQIDTQVALSTHQQTQNNTQAIEIDLLKKENIVIAAQLSEMKELKLAVAQLRSELNKTTVTKVNLPLPVTVN